MYPIAAIVSLYILWWAPRNNGPQSVLYLKLVNPARTCWTGCQSHTRMWWINPAWDFAGMFDGWLVAWPNIKCLIHSQPPQKRCNIGYEATMATDWQHQRPGQIMDKSSDSKQCSMKLESCIISTWYEQFVRMTVMQWWSMMSQW